MAEPVSRISACCTSVQTKADRAGLNDRQKNPSIENRSVVNLQRRILRIFLIQSMAQGDQRLTYGFVNVGTL